MRWNKIKYILIVITILLLIGCTAEQADVQPDVTDTIADLPPVNPTQEEPNTEEPIEEPGPESLPPEKGVAEDLEPDAVTESTVNIITVEEIALHDNEEDCWIVYEGSIFDYTGAGFHPAMAKVFWKYCGDETGFEEGAKDRHSNSGVERVENYGEYIGELEWTWKKMMILRKKKKMQNKDVKFVAKTLVKTAFTNVGVVVNVVSVVRNENIYW